MVQREARFNRGADNSKYRSLAAAKQQSNSIRPPISGPSGANGEAATAWPAAGARAKRMDAYTLVKRRKCPLSSPLIAPAAASPAGTVRSYARVEIHVANTSDRSTDVSAVC